jgi:uncharacterized phage-associated protein
MANVHDVAAFILEQIGATTAMKLQKLAYYSQAWHMVWEENPLFDSEIEAWANGPVIYELYREHKGKFRVDSWPRGDASKLTRHEKSSIRAVTESYGGFTAHQLSEMTHQEDPWLNARAGVEDGRRSNSTISVASMHEYYHGLSRK